LIVATDVRELGDKQVLLNKEAIDIDQDPLAIAGKERERKEREMGEEGQREEEEEAVDIDPLAIAGM
jgi:hypothetical protein